MGIPRPHPPTLLFAAIFSRHEAALEWVLARIAQAWGKIGLLSQRFEVVETAYYERLMGQGLRKQLVSVEGDFDPSHLAQFKLESNAWEREYAEANRFPEDRPLNIDPG